MLIHRSTDAGKLLDYARRFLGKAHNDFHRSTAAPLKVTAPSIVYGRLGRLRL